MNLHFSSVIKQKRLALLLTQQELADKLGITAAAVSKWETNQSYPDITILPTLAKLFDCTIDELLGYSDSNMYYLEKGKKILREFTEKTGFTNKILKI